MNLEATFGTETPIVGMVHLPPLPGAPGSDGALASVLDRARSDAAELEAGGVDAVLVENFGDAPFYPDDVPKHVVAAVTRAADEVRRTVSTPVGVNVLRNDAVAALSVAAAVDAAFVRVNVHAGARVTDQGIVEGRAHETIRLRERLGADVHVLADHNVKHSALLGNASSTNVPDLVERGHADAVVVSGAGTGHAVDVDALESAVDQRDDADVDAPVFVGSGVTPESVADLLSTADGAIVGTAFKEESDPRNPVDEERVRRLVEAVSEST